MYIPYARQSIDRSDIDAVVGVLKSDWLTQGPKIKEFEDALCRYVGARFAVCVSSGTAALHIACLASGIGTGDEAITSPITFVASANCVLYCGARVIFADVNPDSVNINPREIKKKITSRTKVIIPVHFRGAPCDLAEVQQLAKEYNLTVIEDAAHALGAEYKGSKVGSGKYSDMTVFSFHPAKGITAGEGGAVLTNNKKLYERLLMLRNHGITKDRRILKNNPGPWYYQMQDLGFNYRLTDIHSALGISQLRKLDKFIARRQELANSYNRAFKEKGWIKILSNKLDRRSGFHLYVALIDFKKIKKSRKEAMFYLKKHGIQTQVHYIPIYRHPYYKNSFGYKSGDFPVAEEYYQKALTLPLFPAMTNSALNYIIKKVLSLSLYA